MLGTVVHGLCFAPCVPEWEARPGWSSSELLKELQVSLHLAVEPDSLKGPFLRFCDLELTLQDGLHHVLCSPGQRSVPGLIAAQGWIDLHKLLLL